MKNLPTVTEHADLIASASVSGGIALLSALFPAAAPVLAFVPPTTLAGIEIAKRRVLATLEDALKRGEILNLSDIQFSALIPMGIRLLEAARQGECERNLRLLSSYITEELKSDIIEPANFLDMARRTEGLSLAALRAIACIAYRIDKEAANDVTLAREVAITAPLLANSEQMQTPMDIYEAADALADLQGRGFLSSFGSGYGGGEFYKATMPLLELIAKATNLASP